MSAAHLLMNQQKLGLETLDILHIEEAKKADPDILACDVGIDQKSCSGHCNDYAAGTSTTPLTFSIAVLGACTPLITSRPKFVAIMLNSATVEATAGLQMLGRRITPLQNEPVPKHICDAEFGGKCRGTRQGRVGG